MSFILPCKRIEFLADLKKEEASQFQSFFILTFFFADETSLYIPIDKDEFLMKFLRPCKFYPESALQKVNSNSVFFKLMLIASLLVVTSRGCIGEE